MPALHILISGHVQGVGFRYSCCCQAQACGITGWVRNRDGGVVEIHAEGSHSALESFQAWCHEGPSGAHVRNVSAVPTHSSGAARFTILPDEA